MRQLQGIYTGIKHKYVSTGNKHKQGRELFR